MRTLHHYDKINLLKPSARLHNDYRLYNENDLLKLQKIIALKFFGFSLTQIQTLLIANIDIVKKLTNQVKFLQEKARMLQDSSNSLLKIIASYRDKKLLHGKKSYQQLRYIK